MLGLSTAAVTVNSALTSNTKALQATSGPGVTATYLTGPGGLVASSPAAPTLPLVVQNATAPAGSVLRGVGFRQGTYTDTAGVTPLTGAPATESNTTHGPFVSDVFYPDRLATPNYFDALTSSATTGSTRLMVTPAQYRSDAPGSATDVQRVFSSLGFALYYSGNIATYGANTPAAAAAPGFSGVSGVPSTDGRQITFSGHVVGDPAAGIQQVWITWTDPQVAAATKQWASVDLVQDATDSTLWSATLDLPSGEAAADVQFLIQAVNGVGVVGADDALGHYYRIAGADGGPAAGSTLTIGTGVPTSVRVGGSVPVSATLTDQNGAPRSGQAVTFGLGGSSIVAITNASGVASATLPVTAAPGAATLTASFGGGVGFAAARANAVDVTVLKRPTSITLQVGANGFLVTLRDATTGAGLPAHAVFVVAAGRATRWWGSSRRRRTPTGRRRSVPTRCRQPPRR